MSEAKRQQLIAEGRLREDGSRIEHCPTCGKELTAEEAAALVPRGDGDGVGDADVVAAAVNSPEPGQEG